jgi:hypothetical protein
MVKYTGHREIERAWRNYRWPMQCHLCRLCWITAGIERGWGRRRGVVQHPPPAHNYRFLMQVLFVINDAKTTLHCSPPSSVINIKHLSFMGNNFIYFIFTFDKKDHTFDFVMQKVVGRLSFKSTRRTYGKRLDKTLHTVHTYRYHIPIHPSNPHMY